MQPLGPLFANIFLSHHEPKWLSDSPVKPVFYRRYVDDTLWFLPSDADVQLLMSHMNSRHANMRFTVETECNDSISFIGLTISHARHSTDSGLHCYDTTVYRKPTSTGLFMNFKSFVPLAYRLSVLKCLVYRALRLCSNCSLFLHEVSTVKQLLMRNSFHVKVLGGVISRTLASMTAPPTVFTGPAKERIYLGLPFHGKPTDLLRRAIRCICRKYLPHKDVIIYFKSGVRVKNFFQIKDRTPLAMRSSVVYQFTCASCQASYIGQTTRHLHHRVAEHAGVSHLTGRPVKTLVHSSIRDHCRQCEGQDCSLRDFKVLASGSTDIDLLVRERLLIEKLKPALNGNSGSFELLLR